MIFSKLKICLIMGIATLMSVSARDSHSENTLFNPLVTYQTRLQQALYDCRAHQNAPECKLIIQQIQDEMQEMKRKCRDKKYRKDEKCRAVLKVKKKPGWKVRQFCSDNPEDIKCLKRASRKKRRAENLRLLCEKYPEKRKCKNRHASKSKAATEESIRYFCKAHPSAKACKKHRKTRLKAETLPEKKDVYAF